MKIKRGDVFWVSFDPKTPHFKDRKFTTGRNEKNRRQNKTVFRINLKVSELVSIQ